MTYMPMTLRHLSLCFAPIPSFISQGLLRLENYVIEEKLSYDNLLYDFGYLQQHVLAMHRIFSFPENSESQQELTDSSHTEKKRKVNGDGQWLN